VKEPDNTGSAKVHYADLWGMREGKYQTLSEISVNDTAWNELGPHSPYYLFVKRDETDLAEYMQGWKVTDIFPVNVMGVQTHRDHLVIDFSTESLKERIVALRDSQLTDDYIRDKFGVINTRQWFLSNARASLVKDDEWLRSLVQCLYRPFDIRPFFYHEALVDRSRLQIMRNILLGSIALLLPRGVGSDWQHAFVSNHPSVDVAISTASREANQVFPLYLYPAEGEMQFNGGNRRPNLNPEFIKEVSGKLGLTFIEDGRGDLESTFGPEDVFNYTYAVFHSPTYRTRYAEFLKIDFPRLPLTSDKVLFKSLAAKGAELVALHLMESPVLNNLITGYPIAGSTSVERVSYDDNKQHVYINKAQYFEGVPTEVWAFHIGGYQVCQKWLKDRKGRTLTYDERIHYQRIIVALKETIRLMAEIDDLIPGWPVE